MVRWQRNESTGGSEEVVSRSGEEYSSSPLASREEVFDRAAREIK